MEPEKINYALIKTLANSWNASRLLELATSDRTSDQLRAESVEALVRFIDDIKFRDQIFHLLDKLDQEYDKKRKREPECWRNLSKAIHDVRGAVAVLDGKIGDTGELLKLMESPEHSDYLRLLVIEILENLPVKSQDIAGRIARAKQVIDSDVDNRMFETVPGMKEFANAARKIRKEYLGPNQSEDQAAIE